MRYPKDVPIELVLLERLSCGIAWFGESPNDDEVVEEIRCLL